MRWSEMVRLSVVGCVVGVMVALVGSGAGAGASAYSGSSSHSGASASGWAWPVAGEAGFDVGGSRVLAEYRAPPDRYGAGHRGVDLTTLGGSVLAPRDGVVTFAGVVGERPVLVLEHPDGYRSTLEPVVATVAVGALVAAGSPVGTLAAGGHCAGDCLHFGVRLRDEYVNPRVLLGGVPRAVLLPLSSVRGEVRRGDARPGTRRAAVRR